MFVNIFKKFELKWWQAAIYEIGMVSLGIVIGARFMGALNNVIGVFLIIFIVCASYIAYIWYRQISQKNKALEG